MAKPISNKRPDNFWKTLRNLLHYMGNHRFLIAASGCFGFCQRIGKFIWYLHVETDRQ